MNDMQASNAAHWIDGEIAKCFLTVIHSLYHWRNHRQEPEAGRKTRSRHVCLGDFAHENE
jgi:hypothetical protein